MSSKPLTEQQFLRWQKVMRIFAAIFNCHQLRERSFIIFNRQMPLCARCTGLWLGIIILGPILCIFSLFNLHVSVVLICLLLIDGETQYLNLRKSNNILRLLTGLGAGYALDSLAVITIIHTYQLLITS